MWEKTEVSRIVIVMDYPGSVISVNHMKYAGGYYTKPEAKRWSDELGWKVKEAMRNVKLGLPLTIRVSGRFKDRRSVPDLHNLGKLILDSIQNATGINDRYMGFETGESTIGSPPELRIEISG